MGFAKKTRSSSKRRPRSDDPAWSSGVEEDYPDDESSGVYSLDNLVYSYSNTTTVVLPDAVETQLEEVPEEEDEDDAESIPPPPAPPVVMSTKNNVSFEQGDEEGTEVEYGEPVKGCDRKYYVGGTLLALVCIAAIVVVSVIAPSNSAPSTVTSSAVGDSPSTPALSREESFTRLLTNISSQDALQTSGSPQAKALDWLVTYDAAQLDPTSENEQEVQERYILAVFYYTLGGADWFDSFYFLSQNHVCNWKNNDFGLGVSCDDDGKTVTGFKFGPNNLQGNLPTEIFLLKGLTTFQVIMNPGLTGPIPPTIDALDNLETLNLNKNSLTGEIPDTLLTLPSLKTLWMDENNFEGSIPPVPDDSTLQWWSCNNCGLTGRMPDTLRIPNLADL